MRIFTFMAGIAIIAAACNQKTSLSEINTAPVADLKAENLKGQIEQIETDTYAMDSATGKIDKLETKTIEKYNDSGYTNSYSNYSAKDRSTTLTIYGHDANGYTTSINTTKNGKPLSSMKISVDSLGKYTLATSFDSTGKEDVFYTDITSNDYGEVLSGTGHHADSTLKMTFANKFDSVYYVGGESKDSVGKLTYSANIQLNDKKDPAQIDETNVSKDSTTKTNTIFAYDTWDNQGNWTQQTTTENSKPKKIIKRIITYKQ